MSNVIEDNLTLRKELKEAFSEINRLEMQQIQKKQTIYQLNDQIDKLTKQVKQLKEGKGVGVKEVKKRKVIEESIRENQDLRDDTDEQFNDFPDQESFDPIDLSKL